MIGYLDESRPQTTDNNQRLWSLNKPTIQKNTTKYKANTFGFYSPNGNNVLEFEEDSTKEGVIDFLEKIEEKNPEKDIVVILDNFASHKSEKTRKAAKKLSIDLVFLPPPIVVT